ncbi:MAG: YicC family protein [bacterium]|nr:YicC family protein [bacterium]
MKSMTGYGFSECCCPDGIKFTVEIRTVNRKQLDIKLNMPSEFYDQELKIRKLISNKISRGSINVKIFMILSGKILNQTLSINQDILKVYIDNANKLQNSLGIENNLTLKELISLPKVIETTQPELNSESIIQSLFDTVENALENLGKTRLEEGEFLKKDLDERLNHLEDLVNEIEPYTADLPSIYKERLMKKIEDEKIDINDDDRLLREIVIYSDRCDVSEELTRLKSHFKQFGKLLSEKKKSIGRNLDFLTQELQREINTLGVKAANPKTSPLVVTFKTEVEKIREQAQNIE